MKAAVLVVLVLLVAGAAGGRVAEEDNEFAEFEEFDEEEAPAPSPSSSSPAPSSSQRAEAPQPADDEEEARVEEEFDHFQDEEEFEGLDHERPPSRPQGGDKPHLTIAKVPLHLRSNWESFYLELLMLAGLAIYFGNFVAGRNKNHRLATAWFHAHRPLLLENFALVGDDGRQELSAGGEPDGGLVKDSESVYTLWCSGRLCVEGMLVELRLLKRQDLLSLIAQAVRPAADQLVVRVTMGAQSMDGFVMCLATKKTATRLHKTMADLSTYCPEKKRPDKYGLPANFTVLSEMGEVANAMLDAKVLSVIKRYEECIDYIHMSDQYSGPRLQEDTQPTKLPEVKKVLLFGFNGAGAPAGAEAPHPQDEAAQGQDPLRGATLARLLLLLGAQGLLQWGGEGRLLERWCAEGVDSMLSLVGCGCVCERGHWALSGRLCARPAGNVLFCCGWEDGLPTAAPRLANVASDAIKESQPLLPSPPGTGSICRVCAAPFDSLWDFSSLRLVPGKCAPSWWSKCSELNSVVP
ncbi:PAT complex subunit CCDC47-like isoform X1 [Haemaphysalis longicornis]